MDNLDQQIQILVDNAPPDGVTPQLVQAIAPVLKLLANQLQHLEYHILQNSEERWVLFTLSNRAQPQVEKNVIYAFSSLKDATSFQSTAEPDILALPIPVIPLLFQLVALENIDSIVFFETSGDLSAGTEVRRDDVQNLIQEHLQQLSNPNLPPDIA